MTRVAVAVNGTVSAEAAALYALEYAAMFKYDLAVLHVRNPKDDPEAVARSIASITRAAARCGVGVHEHLAEGPPASAVRTLLQTNAIDTLFCSTRQHGRPLFGRSFSETIVRAGLPVDIAVVRIVHVRASQKSHYQHLLLPIREARLSVHKFAFFAAFAKAYGAKADILSVSVMNADRRERMDIARARELFGRINTHLEHYRKLAQMLSISLTLHHRVAEGETAELLHFLAGAEYTLMIVGGERLSFWSRLFGEPPIERLFRQTPINMIAFYPGEGR